MPEIQTSGWEVDPSAMDSEKLPASDGHQALASLCHPSRPFVARIDSGQLQNELREVAEQYLQRIAPSDAALAHASSLLAAHEPEGFGWLPLTWAKDALEDPRGSFSVQRFDEATELDRTIVLLAGNRRSHRQDAPAAVSGLAVGLGVVMHLDPPEGVALRRVRITGAMLSELHRAESPEAHGLMGLGLRPLLRLIRLSFAGKTIRLSGVERTDGIVRIAGVAARSSGSDEAPRGYLWAVTIALEDGAEPRLLSLREQEQVTFSALPRAFLRDAASCGGAKDLAQRAPSRDDAVLDPFRDDVPVLDKVQNLEQARFKVLQSSLASRKNNANVVQAVDPLKLPLRGDDLSAAHAYVRACEFFARLDQFKLSADAFFKFARLPLQLRHRAAFAAHPDGTAVMAQVRVAGAPLAFAGSYTPGARPALEVAFGAADLRHRAVRDDGHGRLAAQPLGLAADPRWAWHEFGHVVSYATTGALEFEFAHSMGDALAAVLNDPASCLAGDPLCDGLTFPWVPANRRHDRAAALGWCWCGRRNGQRRALPMFPPRLFKGYVEEQMLSSSVFRLYRAIGGHPANPQPLRERAATETAYLLLRGAMLLGPAALVPARSAQALVCAMIHADGGTWSPGIDLFLGGRVHKVVRWAFERQGLYATALDDDVEGPGLPPGVDLWIKDRRLDDASDGGYTPVALDWPPDGTEPSWFAHAQQGFSTDGAGVHVTVRNRGSKPASNVVVRAWKAPATAAPLQWQLLGQKQINGPIAGGGSVQATVGANLGGNNPHYVFVEVSSLQDRSNLDPATGLPCALDTPPQDPADVRDLVANDNNLALRRVRA